jgi:hypothetical protein
MYRPWSHVGHCRVVSLIDLIASGGSRTSYTITVGGRCNTSSSHDVRSLYDRETSSQWVYDPPAKKDAKILIGSNVDAMSPASNDIY